MLRRVNVSLIVRGHFDTLVDDRTKKPFWEDYILFFVLPFLVSLALVLSDVLVSEAIANVIITSLSIFAGLLFNLLILAHGMIRATPVALVDERRLIREVYSNISFAILNSVGVIVLCGAVYFSDAPRFLQVISVLSHFLLISFMLTMLMILRRIHILLSREFDRPGPASKA